MDFLKGLLKSEGFGTIMAVVDDLNRYSHFIPPKHYFSVRIGAGVFLHYIVNLHYSLDLIVRERDKIFSVIYGTNSLKYKALN